MPEPHIIRAEDAGKIWQWLMQRDGIAIWASVNLSNPGASWTCPVKDAEGKVVGKPNWQCGERPTRIITDAREVMVAFDREVKRFRVAVRMGTQGLQLKVTAAGGRRIAREVARAGAHAYHVFDYSTQEAVIMVPEKLIPLDQLMAAEVA